LEILQRSIAVKSIPIAKPLSPNNVESRASLPAFGSLSNHHISMWSEWFYFSFVAIALREHLHEFFPHRLEAMASFQEILFLKCVNLHALRRCHGRTAALVLQ